MSGFFDTLGHWSAAARARNLAWHFGLVGKSGLADLMTRCAVVLAGVPESGGAP